MEDGDLVGEVPGTLHDLNIDIGKNNAPRVVQEVEGDFVATVKVTGSFEPGPDPDRAQERPLQRRRAARLARRRTITSASNAGRCTATTASWGSSRSRAESRAHAPRSITRGVSTPRQDLWLRLERHGNVISGFLSRDGQDWEELEPMEVEWPSRLKVGVDVINSCGDPMTVRFQEYSLKTPGDGARAAGLETDSGTDAPPGDRVVSGQHLLTVAD